MSNPKIITYPTTEAITLEEAHLHLRLDVYDSPPVHPDDPLILGQITAAREWAEKFTGRCISPCVLELALDDFPHHRRRMHRFPGWLVHAYHLIDDGPAMPIRLPGGPVVALESVTYVDLAGVQQTLADVQFDTHEEPARVLPAVGATWPVAQQKMAAVRVRYVAGYSAPGDSPNPCPLPVPIKQAMLLVLGHLYENRENSADVALTEVPLGAVSLLRPYRLESAMA